ncbi:hypothetical protein KSF78_0002870 [Schistosoma japonicum]|nr:hypothetical protein KSF78_0002870 [Schistosoma japonicum]
MMLKPKGAENNHITCIKIAVHHCLAASSSSPILSDSIIDFVHIFHICSFYYPKQLRVLTRFLFLYIYLQSASVFKKDSSNKPIYKLTPDAMIQIITMHSYES